MATFTISNSKGEAVGTFESDLNVFLSNAVEGKPNSGGKRYIGGTLQFLNMRNRVVLYEAKDKAASTNGKTAVGSLKA